MTTTIFDTDKFFMAFAEDKPLKVDLQKVFCKDGSARQNRYVRNLIRRHARRHVTGSGYSRYFLGVEHPEFTCCVLELVVGPIRAPFVKVAQSVDPKFTYNPTN